ncbi:PAS domain S-box protein [Aquibacillus sediminis]|uniref:PAS domain S-box protein n=1 Tax=Aquibacillus sediminis TaxID=2574734 RepID=UPI00110833F5|nr:PAS domain S-box protein [Aquibacillus sediminis]
MATISNSIDYSQLIENALIGYVVLNKREIVYANPYIYQLLGYQANERLELDKLLHPDYHLVCNDRLKVVYEQHKSVAPMEQKMIRKDGSIVHVEVFATPYFKENEIYAQVQIVDITDRKSYEKVYEDTELSRQLMNDHISDIITELNVEGDVQYVSPSISNSLGYQPEEIVGMNLFQLIHPEEKEKLYKHYQRLLTARKSTMVRYRALSKSGNFVWLESRGNVFFRGNELRVIADSRNITEQIESEKRLRQTEKMAIIGELSAGIVHEIKNPLTSIKGFLQLMKAGTIKTKDYISILNTEVERIERIAQDLLNFAKPSNTMKKQDLVELVDDVIVLIDVHSKKKNIELIWRRPKSPIYIKADASQIKQVIINLIKNAIEASEEDHQVEVYLETTEHHVFIKVKDDGCGIPKEQLSKIGESFFTTKEKGTGLGLMITQKIIKHHHGTMKIDSVEGEGTLFTIQLPLINM